MTVLKTTPNRSTLLKHVRYLVRKAEEIAENEWRIVPEYRDFTKANKAHNEAVAFAEKYDINLIEAGIEPH